VERSAEAFEKMSGEVSGASASVTQTSEKTGDEVQRFAGETLPEIRQLVSEMRELALSLRHVVDEVEQNPGVLLFGRPVKKRGPGE
jgi:methyl-accepting chemotaxis protein